MAGPDWEDIEKWGHWAAQWTRAYREGLRARPVRAPTRPGEILARLPELPPETPEPLEEILGDFERIILPGMTHWQHPRFFAYFPANSAPVSVLAEWLTATLAAQCMLWQTSPAATELEIRALDWLRHALGLPEGFQGVIQDSASTATLAAVLVMRERALDWAGNRAGLSGQPRLRLYASEEAHSSIDRAAWIAGFGAENLVRIPVGGPLRGMDVERLRRAIAADRAAGFVPAGLVGSVGGTSTGAIDDIGALARIAGDEGLFLHVDAAWAGSAMICPEFRSLWAGIEAADSVVMNPHKWLGAQFDLSAHFLRDPTPLVRTLAVRPDYLRTLGQTPVADFSEWSIPLGRRFRALKLWFLIRAHGLEDLRQRIRNHVAWAGKLADRLAAEPDFELVTGPVLALFTFRHRPASADAGGDPAQTDAHNLALVERLNAEGRIYLTQTRVDGRVAIRLSVGQFETTEADVDAAFEAICQTARAMAAGAGPEDGP